MSKTTPEMEVEQNNSPTQEESEIQADETEIEEGQETEEDQEENPDENSEEEPEEEAEDVDYEGKKYKLPKEIKNALLRNSDYTKKTQEVAEMRKQTQTERENFYKEAQAREQDFKAHAEIYNYDHQLEQYEKYFETQQWLDVIEGNASEAMKIKTQYDTLKALRDQKGNEIARKGREQSQNQQQAIAKQEEETRTTLQRDIKGWNSELEGKLKEYAKAQGFADHVMAHGLKSDATAVKTIHKAFLFDQLKKELATKPKQQTEIKKPIKSIAAKNGGSQSNVPTSKDPMEVWLAKRNAQLNKK